jgi:hypothetical protein
MVDLFVNAPAVPGDSSETIMACSAAAPHGERERR